MQPNPWRDAIDDALTINCMGGLSPDESPRAALARLIAFEIKMALDPAISKEAQDLINHGRFLVTLNESPE